MTRDIQLCPKTMKPCDCESFNVCVENAMRALKTLCVCTICPADYGSGECQCKRDPKHPYYEPHIDCRYYCGEGCPREPY